MLVLILATPLSYGLDIVKTKEDGLDLFFFSFFIFFLIYFSIFYFRTTRIRVDLSHCHINHNRIT